MLYRECTRCRGEQVIHEDGERLCCPVCWGDGYVSDPQATANAELGAVVRAALGEHKTSGTLRWWARHFRKKMWNQETSLSAFLDAIAAALEEESVG